MISKVQCRRARNSNIHNWMPEMKRVIKKGRSSWYIRLIVNNRFASAVTEYNQYAIEQQGFDTLQQIYRNLAKSFGVEYKHE